MTLAYGIKLTTRTNKIERKKNANATKIKEESTKAVVIQTGDIISSRNKLHVFTDI